MKQRRIAVICTRRLDDVLLATAVIRSLRRVARPGMRIEAMVAPEAAPALAGNPDVDEIVPIPHRLFSWREAWSLLRRIFRRYELAVALDCSNRAHVLAFLAAPQRAALIPPGNDRRVRWKRWLSWRSLRVNERAMHTVEQGLRLVERMGMPRWPEIVPPRADASALDRKLGANWSEAPYAVVQPAPAHAFAAWTESGWRAVVEALESRGLRVHLPADRLEFAELTPLLERARVFIGVDSSVTQLAAATGVPTIAIFGPSNVVARGPWPRCAAGRSPAAWKMTVPLQRQGNVWIIQGLAPCAPCLREGCERHEQSRSDCLAELPAARVIATIDAALAAA